MLVELGVHEDSIDRCLLHHADVLRELRDKKNHRAIDRDKIFCQAVCHFHGGRSVRAFSLVTVVTCSWNLDWDLECVKSFFWLLFMSLEVLVSKLVSGRH